LGKKSCERSDWFREPVRATMTRRTKSACEIQRDSIWEFEDGECVVHYPAKSVPYPVRFSGERTVLLARQLREGDHLVLEKARFRVPYGRRETQVFVKRFHIISD